MGWYNVGGLIPYPTKGNFPISPKEYTFLNIKACPCHPNLRYLDDILGNVTSIFNRRRQVRWLTEALKITLPAIFIR